MLKAFKFRIYPTKAQAELIGKHFGCTRLIYNRFLNYRQKAFVRGEKPTYLVTQSILTELKHTDRFAFLNDCSSQSLQMALRQLDTAFANFFAKRANYPRFKSKKNPHQSFCLPQNAKISYENKRVYLPKFSEGIKAKLHRQIEPNAKIKQAFVSKEADKYYCSVNYETNEPMPKPTSIKKAVGLDMGLIDLAVTSDGIVYPNKKFLQKNEKRLAKLQRRLFKKQKGSCNRKKQIAKVAKAHKKVTNARNDYLHKISNEITNHYDFIALETLNVKGMMRNDKLSKSIANVSWNKLINFIAYKAAQKGKTFVQIDRFFPSSQICHNCGAQSGKKPLRIRQWTCPHCGTFLHRDYNAAINIVNHALAMLDDRFAVKKEIRRVGNTRSYACGDSSDGAKTKYGNILRLS